MPQTSIDAAFKILHPEVLIYHEQTFMSSPQVGLGGAMLFCSPNDDDMGKVQYLMIGMIGRRNQQRPNEYCQT
jgi:hypothetical protein